MSDKAEERYLAGLCEEFGHKVCTRCGSCKCDDNPRVSTDKRGRTLCPGCREIANRNSYTR